MKKLTVIVLIPVLALLSVAAGLIQSGWTTTGDPATARAALGVGATGTNYSSLTVTNGITNLINTANTLLKSDANKAITSVTPNAAGAATNDGSGGFGFFNHFVPDIDSTQTNATLKYNWGGTLQTAIAYNGPAGSGIKVVYQNQDGTSPSTIFYTDHGNMFFNTPPFFGGLTANALIAIDGSTQTRSIANAAGALTNDAAGGFGYYDGFAAKDANNILSGNNLFTGQSTFNNVSTFASRMQISAGINVTGGITNLQLSAQTLVGTDSNDKLVSIANGGAGKFLEGTTPPAYRLLSASDIPTNGFFDIFSQSITVTNGVTNRSLTANTVLRANASKAEESIPNNYGMLTNDGNGTVGYTSDGGGLTNLHYAYTTNTVPSTGVLSFGGRAYSTNLQANITLAAFGAVDIALYETLVLDVTNSTASDFTITMPNGVMGTPGSGLPAVFYCTNKQTTFIYVSHLGRAKTNAWKQDFAQ